MHGLERELAGRVQVIHLDVDDDVGRQARAVYGNEKVPTIILLGPTGSEVYRTEGQLPRRDQIREQVARFATSS